MLNKKIPFILFFIIIFVIIILVFILKIDIKELITNKEATIVNTGGPINKEMTGSIIINKDNGTFQSTLGGGGR